MCLGAFRYYECFTLGIETEKTPNSKAQRQPQTSAVENTENTQNSESINDEKKDERDCDENGYNDFGNKKIIKPRQDESYFTYRKEISLLYEKCKNGDSQSCFKYVDCYANGKGVVKANWQRWSLFKACKLILL